MSILEDFKTAASSASYHYADDSGGEWGIARQKKAECLRLYRKADYETRQDMEVYMIHQLWGAEFRRDIALKVQGEEMSQIQKDEVVQSIMLKAKDLDVTQGQWMDTRDIDTLTAYGYGDMFRDWAEDARRRRSEAK